jgi:hypothetical protein
MPTKKEKHGAGHAEELPPTALLPGADRQQVSTIAALAAILEQDIWLAKQKR